MTTLSWREQIPATEPVSKYENVVENMIRDKESGWTYDYYKDPHTGYDMHVGRVQGEIYKHGLQIKKHEASLEKIAHRLEASKKEKTDPAFKKLSPKEVEALELEYTDVYKLKCEQMVYLDASETVRKDLSWKQYLQRKRLSLLHALRNQFMFDGNQEYMRRGVTWIEEYIQNLRQSSA